MSEFKVDDATGAQAAAKRHLEAHYGVDKIRSVKFTRTWYAGDLRGMFGRLRETLK